MNELMIPQPAAVAKENELDNAVDDLNEKAYSRNPRPTFPCDTRHAMLAACRNVVESWERDGDVFFAVQECRAVLALAAAEDTLTH